METYKKTRKLQNSKNQKIFWKLVGFFGARFWLLLLIVVFISYGQTLFMLPWQDDNALFFKLAHIQEPAGFLGKGIFGEGAYRYTAFFYYPVYLLFGHQPFFYFLQGFIFYFLSVYVVYAIVLRIFDKQTAKITSFLYACGYLASDGYIRIFNSVVTSLSVILISSLFYFYWSYFQKRRLWFYLFALFSFIVASEIAPARTHYLIGVIFLFEVCFSIWQSGLGSIYKSVFRIFPFTLIFYKYFLENADSRSQNVVSFVKNLLNGKLAELYGFLGSLTNLFVPDWVTRRVNIFLFSLFLGALLLLVFKNLKSKFFIILLAAMLVAWRFLAEKIFRIPSINPSAYQINLVYFGGVLIFIFTLIAFLFKAKYRKYYLFFLGWIVLNLLSYSAYSPEVIFESINRYFAHSFFALTVLMGVIYKSFAREKKGKFLAAVFLLWGLGNLTYAFAYQNRLLRERTLPVKSFYQSLAAALPKIEKGDLIYFEVADDARGYFADAFSVAQMPEETAIAWRYGLDRYDFYLSSDYNDFINKVRKNSIPKEKIHPFFYSKANGLVSVRDQFISGIRSCVPHPTLTLRVSAKPKPESLHFLEDKNFPREDVLKYLNAKNDFYKNTKAIVSSSWQERIAKNLIDSNLDTAWQADRVTWDKKKTFFGFDLGKEILAERLVWINAFGNNTPTSYEVEVSLDGVNWKKVAEVNEVKRIDAKHPNEIRFLPSRVRFVRMIITHTLNSDSAGIAEAWVIPAGLEKHSALELENYLASPQAAMITGVAKVNVFWQAEGIAGWTNDNATFLNLALDGRVREYTLTIPCRGISLKDVKLESSKLPLEIDFREIRINHYLDK